MGHAPHADTICRHGASESRKPTSASRFCRAVMCRSIGADSRLASVGLLGRL
jgi:hypothetical protein